MVDHTIYGGYPNTWLGYQRPPVYQNSSSTIIFVKGIDEAKQYPQAPGTTLTLWDSEVDVFYRKSTDTRGNVIEFEVYDYTKREIEPESKDDGQNEIIASLAAQVEKLTMQIEGMRNDNNRIPKKQGGVNNGKSNV